MHPNSITLTIDDEDPAGLWNVMSQSQRSASKKKQEQQRRLIRFGFHFFRVGRGGRDRSRGASSDAVYQRRQQQVYQSSLRPYGPVPQGGTGGVQDT